MELDLFGQSYDSQPWWKKYLTGGEFGPGGENRASADALRKRFESSTECMENGWGPRYRGGGRYVNKAPREFWRKGA